MLFGQLTPAPAALWCVPCIPKGQSRLKPSYCRNRLLPLSIAWRATKLAPERDPGPARGERGACWISFSSSWGALRVEGLYAASGFEIPYEDTAQGKIKEWLVSYKKMFGADANTQAIIGYNAVEIFAFYANLAGRDLTGQKFLEALESGKEYQDIFGSPPVRFSRTNHLATEVTQVRQ
jgi:hypothetical protein